MMQRHVAVEERGDYSVAEEERNDYSDAATDPSTAQPLTQTQP